MKKALIFVPVILLVAANVVFGQESKSAVKFMADTVAADSLEHRLIVLDPGFDSWLATQPSKDFYSQRYYESRNRLYVTEWNHRYSTGADPRLYETQIDYNYRIDYGIDINYRLYNYFRFFEHKTGIKLINTSRN